MAGRGESKAVSARNGENYTTAYLDNDDDGNIIITPTEYFNNDYLLIVTKKIF